MQLWKKISMAFATAAALTALVALIGCSGGSNAAGEKADAAAEGASEPVQLQIFAANSLSKALDEVQSLYTQNNPDVTFADTQYKASGELVEMLRRVLLRTSSFRLPRGRWTMPSMADSLTKERASICSRTTLLW